VKKRERFIGRGGGEVLSIEGEKWGAEGPASCRPGMGEEGNEESVQNKKKETFYPMVPWRSVGCRVWRNNCFSAQEN